MSIVSLHPSHLKPLTSKKEHALLKDGLDLSSLSIPGCSAGWRNWRSNVGGAFVKWEDGIIQAFKRGKENSVDFWQNTSKFRGHKYWLISIYVKRSRCEAADGFWLNEVGRLYVWLRDWSPCLSAHLHPSTLSTSCVLFCWLFQHFFRELMMVICRKRSDLDLVTTCKRGSELKTRPPTVSTETSSLLL